MSKTRSRLQPIEVRDGRRVTGFAAAGKHFVVTLSASERGDPTSATIGEFGGAARRVVGKPTENFGYPVAVDHVVGWAESSGGNPLAGYVYDFRKRELYRVGKAAGFYGLEGQGSRLAWQEGPKGWVVAELR